MDKKDPIGLNIGTQEKVQLDIIKTINDQEKNDLKSIQILTTYQLRFLQEERYKKVNLNRMLELLIDKLFLL